MNSATYEFDVFATVSSSTAIFSLPLAVPSNMTTLVGFVAEVDVVGTNSSGPFATKSTWVGSYATVAYNPQDPQYSQWILAVSSGSPPPSPGVPSVYVSSGSLDIQWQPTPSDTDTLTARIKVRFIGS